MAYKGEKECKQKTTIETAVPGTSSARSAETGSYEFVRNLVHKFLSEAVLTPSFVYSTEASRQVAVLKFRQSKPKESFVSPRTPKELRSSKGASQFSAFPSSAITGSGSCAASSVWSVAPCYRLPIGSRRSNTWRRGCFASVLQGTWVGGALDDAEGAHWLKVGGLHGLRDRCWPESRVVGWIWKGKIRQEFERLLAAPALLQKCVAFHLLWGGVVAECMGEGANAPSGGSGDCYVPGEEGSLSLRCGMRVSARRVALPPPTFKGLPVALPHSRIL